MAILDSLGADVMPEAFFDRSHPLPDGAQSFEADGDSSICLYWL